MVGVITRSGGTHGIVDALTPYATTPRRGLLMPPGSQGLAIFFDDYANTLIVGNTMRPVTDRLRISREKLAYIVDSTAAPMAASCSSPPGWGSRSR
jgi:Na+/H+ antiporter NhaC